MYRTIGWACTVLVVAALSACGGGGGDSDVAPTALTTKTEELRTGHAAAASGHSEDQSQLATKADGGTDSALRPLAASRFSRANTYHVYAANGSRKLLRLDFASRQYEMLDSVGQSTSGSFSEDASEPGTYVFASSRIVSPTNTARFRVTQGAVVGAFPFEKPWSSPTAYPVVPFVAASDFVSSAAELDGDYNRLGISLSSNGTTDSQILPLRISGGGTVLEMCFDNVIYRMELCPTGSKRTYSIVPSTDSIWTATSTAPNDLLQFRMARINGQNVWLSGGWTEAAPDTRVFRVGLHNDADWGVPGRYLGAATDGSWGSNTLSNTTSKRSSVSPDGSLRTQELPVSSWGTLVPSGLRGVNANGTDKYLATKNAALSVIVGTRNPSTQGFIQLGLFKEFASDIPPVGAVAYTAFSIDGGMQTLTLDLGNNAYQMTDGSGAIISGTVARLFGVANTYRFGNETDRAHFTLKDDAIVGAFPFWNRNVAARTLSPFIAVQSLITDAAQLDGLYNDIQVVRRTSPSSFSDSLVTSFRIEGGGTRLISCASYVITTYEACEAKVTLHLQRGASEGEWIGLTGAPYVGPPYNDPTMIAMQRTLRFARIGGEVVALHSTITPTLPAYYGQGNIFRIALPEPAAWTSKTGRGWSTSGDSGTFDATASLFTVQWAAPSSGLQLTAPAGLLPIPGRTGLRGAGSLDQYLVAQSGALTVLASSHTNYTGQGYLLLGMNN